jgi:hypothetical protein
VRSILDTFQQQSEDSESNDVSEEDKYKSSDNDDDIIVESDSSESKLAQNMYPKKLKTKISKRTGPHPSMHGVNMVPDGAYQDQNSIYYQNPPKSFGSRMPAGYQYPPYGGQMPFPNMNSPLNPIENISMVSFLEIILV